MGHHLSVTISETVEVAGILPIPHSIVSRKSPVPHWIYFLYTPNPTLKSYTKTNQKQAMHRGKLRKNVLRTQVMAPLTHTHTHMHSSSKGKWEVVGGRWGCWAGARVAPCPQHVETHFGKSNLLNRINVIAHEFLRIFRRRCLSCKCLLPICLVVFFMLAFPVAEKRSPTFRGAVTPLALHWPRPQRECSLRSRRLSLSTGN